MAQKITISDAIVRFLSLNGIDTVFGVLGDAVFPLFDALGKQADIKCYWTSHETGAAFMASYYAKYTGKAGVCISTSGPGCANLVNGLADAYYDRAPVLAITGQVQTMKVGTNAKQYINQQVLMQAVTKSSELVTDAQSVIPIIAKALAMAVNHHTVTHVSIPVDLFMQQVNNTKLPAVSINDPILMGSGYADRLEHAVRLLEASTKTLIVVGKGKPEWRPMLRDLADKLGAGIILSQQAKGVVPDREPEVIGGIGEAYVPAFLKEAECILLLGNASFETKFLPGTANLVQVVDSHENLDYSILTTGLVGDMRQIIKVLSERVSINRNPSWGDIILKEKHNLETLVASQGQNKVKPIHPAFLMVTLNKVIPKDSVIVCDIGGFMHWFDTYFQAEDHTVLISGNWRSMGCGLPGALGACLSRQGKQVVALVGDGGLLMSVGELATAVKYQLPVLIVAANNQQYNLEKTKMEAQGLTPFGHELTVPDFAALARAFGCDGRLVSEPDQLEAALKEGLGCGRPFVVDVNLNTESLPFL